MNFVGVKKKEILDMINMGNNVLAANNILKFALNSKNKTTDGMSGVACGDVGGSQVGEAGTVSGRSLRS